MNVFNRIVIVLGILVWLAILFFVAAQPLETVDLVKFNFDYFGTALLDLQIYYAFLGVVGGLALLLLVLLWLEVRRPKRKVVRIKTTKGGKAYLGVQSVTQSLEYRIDELAGVRQVRPHITSLGRDVKVVIDLDTSPSVNIPVLTDQIVDLCHDIVEGQLGVKIHGKVEVDVSHAPYPRGTMPPTEPFGGEAVAVPPTPPQAQPFVVAEEEETVTPAEVEPEPEPTGASAEGIADISESAPETDGEKKDILSDF